MSYLQHLSERAAKVVPELDIPWRFAPRSNYDPKTNPSGLISFASAENTLVKEELEEFVANNARAAHLLQKPGREPSNMAPRTQLHVPADAFSYQYSTAGGPRFPRALAAHLNECFRPAEPLDGSEIQAVSAATALHDVLAWACGDPGDGILTSVPVYGRFELDFGNRSGVRMVYADTDADTSFRPDVVDRFQEALDKAQAGGTRICALLIVNPNNPLGKCYPRETLEALMAFCQRHAIHFISDEVYGATATATATAPEADIDNDDASNEAAATPFTSALAATSPALIDRELCHVSYGLSKDFGCAGLRLGAVVTRGRAVHRALASVVRFANPSGASVAIATAMLEDRAWCRRFLALGRARLARARAHAARGLDALGVRYVRAANAGFFLYVDLSPYLPPAEEVEVEGEGEGEVEVEVEVEVQVGGGSGGSGGDGSGERERERERERDRQRQRQREFALARRLVDAGIFLHPGEEHNLQPGWFRFVFTQEESIVTEGLRRLKTAISS